MLEVLTFTGTTAMKPLLSALEILRRLSADEIRKIPADAPTSFVRERWRDYVFTEKGIDRRYYESLGYIPRGLPRYLLNGACSAN